MGLLVRKCCEGEDGEVPLAGNEQRLICLEIDKEIIELILLNIPDAVCLTDLEGRFRFVCANVKNIFGYDANEFMARGFVQRFLGEDFIDLVNSGVVSGIENVERVIRRKDGRYRNVLATASRVSISGHAYLIVCRDITDLKQNEEKLFLSEKRFRQFFDENSEYCYMITPDKRILDANKAALEFLGFDDAKELKGRPALTTIYPPSSQKRVEKLFLKFLEQGKLRDEQIEVESAEGEKRVVLLNADAVVDDEGNLLYSTSRQIDITDRLHAERLRHEKELFFRRAFEESPAMMSVTTIEEGEFLDINRAFESKTGFERAEVLGRTAPSIGFASLEVRKELRRRFLRDGAIDNWQITANKKSGQELNLLVSARSIEMDGQLRLLTSAIDMTERKIAEERLLASVQQLQNLNLALDQKNAALQELMHQASKEKKRLEADVERNIERRIKPLLNWLAEQCPESSRSLCEVINTNLEALTSSRSAKLTARMQGLSRRELEVANLISAGKKSREIAELLGLSPNTVENHRARIRKKLGVTQRGLSLGHLLAELETTKNYGGND